MTCAGRIDIKLVSLASIDFKSLITFKLKIKLHILAPLHLRLPVREGSSNNDDKSELGQEVF